MTNKYLQHHDRSVIVVVSNGACTKAFGTHKHAMINMKYK